MRNNVLNIPLYFTGITNHIYISICIYIYIYIQTLHIIKLTATVSVAQSLVRYPAEIFLNSHLPYFKKKSVLPTIVNATYDLCIKFQFTSSRCTGILLLYGRKFVPLVRDLGCFSHHINTTTKITVNYQQAKILVNRDIPIYRDHINRPSISLRPSFCQEVAGFERFELSQSTLIHFTRSKVNNGLLFLVKTS